MQTPYSKENLYKLGPQPTYSGRNLDEIAFPLGGIGTGSISLGGWGQLRDWEIMNRPAKGFTVPRSFFALKVRFADKPPVMKVLEGPVGGSYVGDGHSLVPQIRISEYGLPRFRKASFVGHFPIAALSLEDPEFPVRVTLEAFNPFIPLNDRDSSIPAAVLLFNFENISDDEVSATVYGNLSNVIGHPKEEGRVNEAKREQGVTGLHLSNNVLLKDSPRFGSMVLATSWSDADVWPRWKEDVQPSWMDSHLSKFWEAVAVLDEFPPKGKGESDTGTVAANFTLKPHSKGTVVFILAWHFPTFEHYWGKRGEGETAPTWTNYYATLWKDAWDVALYVASNLTRLWEETKLFRDALFSTTLPVQVLDAVSSQLSTLKTNTCLRLEDGTFYGFEGCSNTLGCCEGSCTHVWNYAQALPYLFPNLQRSLLDAHLANCVQDDGFMTFRMPLPLGTKAEPSYHPAADGQMGCILQVYREWLISGDDEWLRKVWPEAKKLLQFAWKYWDADKDGVMEGMQHNTYDIEFYGPNTLTGSLYLAALRVGGEIARRLGEPDKAREYRELFENGSKWSDEHLFNGEYYEQRVNPTAHEAWPEPYRGLALKHGKDDKFKDWPKWQFGKGCLSDQMIGQWYAHMLDLGYLYDPANVKKTLQSIFRHNWKPNLWDHPCLFRIYAVDGESGLVVCTWPRDERPGYALIYADEVWCGIEYQVASHMIYEGMVTEGLAVVMGTRNRHRGDRRNPWDEFECGHHYARSMASYSLLPVLSGFSYCASEKRLGFSPRIHQEDFETFFSTATGWGLYSQKISKRKAEFTLESKYGSQSLKRLDLPRVEIEEPVMEVTLDGSRIKAKIGASEQRFTVLLDSVLVKRGQTLRISVSRKRG